MNANISECNENDLDYLNRNIIAYNASEVPFTQNIPFLQLNFKIENNNTIIAGINSILYCWGCLHIDILFVDKEHRGKGYGTILMKKVEEEAKKSGCHLIHLDTFDFQAKDFYLKQGYEIFGELINCPQNHTRYYFKKEI
jgi:GNAT superfamily N-acetyltransferase